MYVCMNVCIYVRTYVCMYECMYVCMYVCIYVCMYVCIYVPTYVCTYVCMYVCMYECIYVRDYRSNRVLRETLCSTVSAISCPFSTSVTGCVDEFELPMCDNAAVLRDIIKRTLLCG